MQIVLLILKIIGILLCVILGLILALILASLFVPIRYYLKASRIIVPKECSDDKIEQLEMEKLSLLDEISILIKGSWFFPCCYGMFAYQQKKVTYWFKVFGFALVHSEKQSKPRKKKPKKQKKKKEKKENQDQESILRENITEKEISIPQIPEVVEVESKQEIKSVLDAENSNENLKKSKKIFSFFDKIREIREKIRRSIEHMIRFFSNIGKNFQDIGDKVSKIKIFFQEDETKTGFSILWSFIKKLLLHLKPQKVKGNIHFGTGDPCSTGQILGVLGILYTYYGKSFTIVPEFEEAVLEGELEVKGRIRLVTLLIIAIKLLLNKELKLVWHRFQNLKEEL